MREQSRSFAAAGRRKSPEAVPRQTVRTGNATERIIILLVAVAVETAQSKPSPIREPGTGSRRRRSAVVAEMRGKETGTPGILSKDQATTRCTFDE